jgi:NCK-associated protein 1
LDCPDPVGQVFSEAFWKAGVLPNYPRICLLLSKNFPEHFSKLQLERVRIFSILLEEILFCLVG